MHKLPTKLNGPLFLAPAVHGDDRGFFLETYRRNAMEEMGIAQEFVQDNHSRSRRGIIRGMHFQPGQAKLIRCVRGAIFDVVVDVRPGSPQFGEWESFVLDDVEHRMLFCPDGFAHGFCVLSDVADVIYKQSSYYSEANERGIAYDDPDIAIDWPIPVDDLQPSARDANAPLLRDVAHELPFRFDPVGDSPGPAQRP